MKFPARLALIALTSALASAAHAEPYVGLNLGKSQQKLDWGPDDKDLAWKLYGGYNFNQTFGVEAGYVAHGKMDLNRGHGGPLSRASTLYLAGTASLPLSAQFSLIGKLGIADNRHKWTDLGYPNPTTTNTVAMAGIGLRYAVSPTLSGVLELEDFGKVYEIGTGHIKAHTLSIGLRKSF